MVSCHRLSILNGERRCCKRHAQPCLCHSQTLLWQPAPRIGVWNRDRRIQVRYTPRHNKSRIIHISTSKQVRRIHSWCTPWRIESRSLYIGIWKRDRRTQRDNHRSKTNQDAFVTAFGNEIQAAGVAALMMCWWVHNRAAYVITFWSSKPVLLFSLLHRVGYPENDYFLIFKTVLVGSEHPNILYLISKTNYWRICCGESTRIRKQEKSSIRPQHTAAMYAASGTIQQ